MEWLRKDVYEKDHAIDKEDMELYRLVDSADEAFQLILKWENNKCSRREIVP